MDPPPCRCQHRTIDRMQETWPALPRPFPHLGRGVVRAGAAEGTGAPGGVDERPPEAFLGLGDGPGVARLTPPRPVWETAGPILPESRTLSPARGSGGLK